MTPCYPPWLTLRDDAPHCTRCGASWDRALAAEGDAICVGLVAFAEYHAGCTEGEAEEPASPVVPDSDPVVLPIVGPFPRGHCPKCGTKYRTPTYRRCYVCLPWQRSGAGAASNLERRAERTRERKANGAV